MVDGAYQLCVQVWADYYNLTMLIQTYEDHHVYHQV